MYRRKGWLLVTAGIGLAFAALAAPAFAAKSDSSATSNSSDWFSTSDGWNTDRIFYGTAPAFPVGRWDDQYMNSFAGVPTPPGPGWNTWSFLNKPATLAGWTGSYKSNPYPHVDTSAFGSTDKNYTYLVLYRGFPIINPKDLYAKKQTYSNANAKNKADNPAVAETRITDPWTLSAPVTGNDWSVELDYTQFGSFDGGEPDNTISSQYSIVVTASDGSETTYNLFTVTLTAGGTASVTSDVNNNNAAETDSLVPDQLNGVLMFNGTIVDAATATTDLLSFYNPMTGWDLNPMNYTIDGFQPDDSTQVGNVFNLSASLFFDPSTASVTISSTDESIAVANIPETSTWIMLSAGFAGLGLVSAGRARRWPVEPRLA